MKQHKVLLLVTLIAAVVGVFGTIGFLALEPSTAPTNAFEGDSSGITESAATQPTQPTVWAIGDSLMVGATTAFLERDPDILIDAEVGRRFDQGVERLATMLDDTTPDILVFALGTNNGATGELVEQVLDLADDIDRIVLVGVSIPRGWEEQTNSVLSAAAAADPGVTFVDWNEASRGNEALFRSDGYHLSGEGIHRWVDLIRTAALG